MSDRPGESGSPVSAELSRDLTLFHVMMMGLGMMIGAGVFVGIGLTMPKVGPGGLLLTFALNGVIAVFTAMSFAELSSAIPRAGGAYNFARIGFGRGASFVAGWMEWFASSLAGAFYAIVFARATVDFVVKFILDMDTTGLGASITVKVVALAAAGVFIYINYRGSSETGKIGAIFTVAQMLFVLAIGVAGLVVAIVEPQRMANFQPFLGQDGSWWSLLGTMGVIYVAFEGFEVIAQAGDETIDPKRNIPKAMLYSVAIVTVTYVLVALASVVAFSKSGEAMAWFGDNVHNPTASFTGSIEHLIPIPGAGWLLVTFAIIASSTSALNATIYSATRASFALGRDRMLPPFFAKISPTRKTPYVALAFTAVIVLIAAGFLNEHDGAATASIMFLFLFFVVNLCVIRIRVNMGDELEYGFLMPLFPLLPILAMVCQIALGWGIMGESLVAWIIGPSWVIGGIGVYMLYSRSRVPPVDHEIQVLHEQSAPEAGERRYGIMVAVGNPANALELVQNTYKLCGAKDARVELLHMVTVPDQVPLSDAAEYMHEGRESIMETMLYLGPLFPISSHLRYCRSVSRGILSGVRDNRVDMLVMGWHGRPKARTFNLGSTVDPIIERAPCNVVVLKGCGGNQVFKRVLVPLAGGLNGLFALEIAKILVDPEDGEVTAVTVDTGRRRRSFDIGAFVETNIQAGKLTGPIQTKTITSAAVVEGILAEAADYDLVVMGCTRQPLVSQLVHTPIPETIAQRCDKPLVMVKASGRIRSWIKRWI
ncbi:MAG: amino acid permease [Phycisphaerae bacterium]|nr:amino acid permease [Phycisphaerae bacterium]